jgi:hypothetical protein
MNVIVKRLIENVSPDTQSLLAGYEETCNGLCPDEARVPLLFLLLWFITLATLAF